MTHVRVNMRRQNSRRVTGLCTQWCSNHTVAAASTCLHQGARDALAEVERRKGGEVGVGVGKRKYTPHTHKLRGWGGTTSSGAGGHSTNPRAYEKRC